MHFYKLIFFPRFYSLYSLCFTYRLCNAQSVDFRTNVKGESRDPTGRRRHQKADTTSRTAACRPLATKCKVTLSGTWKTLAQSPSSNFGGRAQKCLWHVAPGAFRISSRFITSPRRWPTDGVKVLLPLERGVSRRNLGDGARWITSFRGRRCDAATQRNATQHLRMRDDPRETPRNGNMMPCRRCSLRIPIDRLRRLIRCLLPLSRAAPSVRTPRLISSAH